MSRRLSTVVVAAGFALAASLLVAPSTATVARGAPPPAPGGDQLDVYVVEVDQRGVDALLALGVDRHDLEITPVAGEPGTVRVEAILSGAQAASLRRTGIEVSTEKVDGLSAAQRSTAAAADGFEVFKKYSGPGGLKQEFQQLAAANRRIAKLVSIGTTVNGQDIVALKVTKGARRTRDGRKPAVLYLSAQHAREWITPEMTRRLAGLVLDQYGDNRRITRLVDRYELWFVPVANPDGYDFTFEPGQRLWRKNLRDNNGDGVIAPGDGVDLNRNYATRWGYDNEGSSPSPASETYRGPRGNSEPESKALDRFMGRVGFEFFVNYHSAAELLLYGTGWQVATPTPDDVIYEAMAGDDAEPAVPGYDPDISAELYTTNGDTDTHMTARFGTLGFTPEMTTCEVASDSVPDDEWEAEDCESGFNFPDDEGLVEAEFRKNVPFALSVASSVADPDDPASVVGRNTPNFVLDEFRTSYGSPQPVAVTAKRSLRRLELNYRVNGGRLRTADADRWRGGERYGDENDDYYAEFRGVVRNLDRGDRVRVWFTAVDPDMRTRRGPKPVRSKDFRFTVASDSGARVLIVANEDYEGVNPTYDPPITAPKYVAAHRQALRDAGYRSDVWDVDARGVPHDLGVLGHYDAVVWYLGDNRITQDPEDELISTEFGELPDIGVAERQQYLTLAIRDYLNEGGKLVHAGETAQYQGLTGISDIVGGLYYGLNGEPESECVVSPGGFFDDCLILADDFRQYYLGAFNRIDGTGVDGVAGTADPLTGYAATFGGPVVEGANPLDEAGVFTVTSDVLPADEFPQFESAGVAEYATAGEDPYAPIEGTRYAGAVHQDNSYMRLTKSIDLTGASAAELAFALSFNTEPSYDNVIVEARTAGGDDWTTLPSAATSEVATQTDPPAECEAGGFLLTLHPFLEAYLGGADCTEGEWNSFTSAFDGSNAGWNDAVVDLSGFAGSEVEISISYVTDPGGGGVGVFVDDTRVTVDGVVDADGFEGATSSWTVGGPPAGSPPNSGDWAIGEKLVAATAATATDDTVLLGFGLEQLDSSAARAILLRRVLRDLL